MKFCGTQIFSATLMALRTEQKSILHYSFPPTLYFIYIYFIIMGSLSFHIHSVCRRTGITNNCKDIFLIIAEFITQCQLVKIVLKLSLLYTGWDKSRLPVLSMQNTDFISVLFINNYIISHMNNCRTTFVPHCICEEVFKVYNLGQENTWSTRRSLCIDPCTFGSID